MLEENRLFCFGFGYTCDALAYFLQNKGGWSIGGTTRNPEKRQALRERGIHACLVNEHGYLSNADFILRDITHIIISTPPDDSGDPVFPNHADDIARLKNLKWIGYLSTTGVYGDRDGAWVDETTELRPSTKRGSRRLRAEEQWLSLFHKEKLPVHVFRLAGIYGVGRSALDSVRAGIARRIDKAGQAFSRVHVADIVQTLYASMQNPTSGEIYNVCDDEPAPSHEVIAYACHLLGVDLPPLVPFEEAHLAPITRSFYSENKRVRNDKIKSALNVSLHYPDFRAGLRACQAEEENIVISI